VAINAIPVAKAVAGYLVMVVVVVAARTPTVTGTVNGRPEDGGCSTHQEGNPRNSESSDDDCSVDEPASQMDCQTKAPDC